MKETPKSDEYVLAFLNQTKERKRTGNEKRKKEKERYEINNQRLRQRERHGEKERRDRRREREAQNEKDRKRRRTNKKTEKGDNEQKGTFLNIRLKVEWKKTKGERETNIIFAKS